MRSVDSQTNLLRSALYRSSSSVDTAERPSFPRAATHDILPLVIVMWDRTEEEGDAESSAGGRGVLPNRSSASQLRELLKDSMAPSEEKVRLFIKQRAENRRGMEMGRKTCENPRFVSISVIHFLRNHSPTLIRRLNICPDGIFVPRVGRGEER